MINCSISHLGNNNRIKVPFLNIAKPFIFLIVLIGAYILSSSKLNIFFNWLYFILLIVNTIILTCLMNPALINERAKISENTAHNDILYALFLGRLGPLIIIIIAGIDNRFGWTSTYSMYIKIISLIIIIIGLAFTDWAVITNRYFSGVVRIQKERRHEVIASGPYKYIRHPGYIGLIIYIIATPIILNTLWGIIPSLTVIILTILRTKNEDQFLQKELDGYQEYSKNVRYRLVPYVW